MSLPTDREILRCIFKMYKSAYPGKETGETRGKNDPYLPIKITEVASRLGCSPEMLFGRLYYHIDEKYRYTQDNNAQVHLFSLKVGTEMHCVNFPYLAAVLAEKNEERKRQLWSLGMAIAALIMSVASIIAQVVTKK
jgi:hypothetical protein